MTLTGFAAFSVIALALVAGLGVISLVYLGLAARDATRRRRRAAPETRPEVPPVRSPTPSTAATSDEPPPDAEDEPPPDAEDEPPPDSEDEPPPERQPSVPARSVRRQSERRVRLQRLLDEGETLMRRAPQRWAPVVSSLAHPTTTQVDVDAWEAKVEAELVDQNRPRDLSVFRYEPARSPLAAFTATPLGNSVRDRLNARLQQLDVIVRKTR